MELQNSWPNGDIPSVVNQGTYSHIYTDDEVLFYVSPNTTTGYAFEFYIESS